MLRVNCRSVGRKVLPVILTTPPADGRIARKKGSDFFCTKLNRLRCACAGTDYQKSAENEGEPGQGASPFRQSGTSLISIVAARRNVNRIFSTTGPVRLQSAKARSNVANQSSASSSRIGTCL